MRLSGQALMGYYPTPETVTALIRERLQFPERPFAALDPCAGCGTALAQAVTGTQGRTYGIEPDEGRAAIARANLNSVLESTLEEARISHASFSLLWLNPPYDGETLDEEDQESTGRKTTRKERTFLTRTLPLLAPAGVLVFIVPGKILDADTRLYFATKLDNLECFWFPEPERERFKQAIAIGTRRLDKGTPQAVPPLLDTPPNAPRHKLPISNPNLKIWRTNRLTETELLTASAASKNWDQFRQARTTTETRRPPLPLHAGHLSILLANGSIDGIIGSGEDRHLARGKTQKRVKTTQETSVSEETGSTTTVTTKRDKYTVALKVLRPDGRILELI